MISDHIQNCHNQGYFLESILHCHLMILKNLKYIFSSKPLEHHSMDGFKTKKLYQKLKMLQDEDPITLQYFSKKNLKAIKAWFNNMQNLLTGKCNIRSYKSISEHSIKVLALVNMAAIKKKSAHKSNP
ncbi:MAG: hypothetical protein ACO27Q_07600 [Bacteroidia bacterium]|jgi:hypothetical protein